MTTMASQITSLTVVYSIIYSDADQRKHQSSASLAFVWGIHRDRWIPRTKGQLRGKCFHLMTSSWHSLFERYLLLNNVYLNYTKQKLTTTIQQWVGTWLSCIHVRLLWITSLNSSWFMVAYISYMRHETQRFHLCVTNPTFFFLQSHWTPGAPFTNMA